jgi:SNF2 family DNA or RNA helicase
MNLFSSLNPHQIEGVRYMFDALFNKTPGGCIIAHSMGLGKTLSLIALLHTVLLSKAVPCKDANKVLILAPLTLVLNWQKEFAKWLSKDQIAEIGETIVFK